MAKVKKTATEQMKELLEEQSKIHAAYDSAIETAQSEYQRLEKEFYQAQKEYSEVNRGYILNQLTHEAYVQEKKNLAAADERLRDEGHKLDTINQYRKEDLRELLGKMEAIVQEYGKEKVASEMALKYKVYKAKYDYLKTVHELAEEHKDIWKVSREVEDLRVALGLKTYNYVSFGDVFRGLLSNNYNGKQGLDITEQELEDAFYKGTFNKRFLDEIETGKKAGFID